MEAGKKKNNKKIKLRGARLGKGEKRARIFILSANIGAGVEKNCQADVLGADAPPSPSLVDIKVAARAGRLRSAEGDVARPPLNSRLHRAHRTLVPLTQLVGWRVIMNPPWERDAAQAAEEGDDYLFIHLIF